MTLHLLEVGLPWPPQSFIQRKLEGLAARGVRVSVVANAIRDPEARLDGVQLLEAPTRPAWREALALALSSPRRLLRLLRAVRRVPPRVARRQGGRLGVLRRQIPLARLRPDVVHIEWNMAALDHLPLFDAWDCPVVASCRGAELTSYTRAPCLSHLADRLPEVLARATAVHCVSDTLVREAARLGLDPGKARVIRPAVDPARFGPRVNGSPGELRVVAVSELRWEKGYEYALLALRALVGHGVPAHLELIGEPPAGREVERARVLHTVADLGLEARVRLAGTMPPGEVARRLARSDVLVQSSLDEGIPNAVIEAMATGLPVVTSDAGGVRELVTDGVEGFVVRPRDPEALCAALLRLWRDPDLAARMGAAGRARVEGGFTLEQQLQDFLALYRDVVPV